MKAIHVIITGDVQGVAFRFHAKNKALSLGISGWVRNRLNGSVEAFFQGESSAVDAIAAWCHQGPPSALVAHVLFETATVDASLKGFVVRSTC
ncbi:acylphosphatase [Anoxynatronum buryatiense]|uniref:Acylphosphatase n=1 Tax=Anoxynatronum buryatiense TaxID=489973 RepID=A0AA46AI94_9CLOT|nr:acylphosphatase [Anoxynatronum buryatiense]SMP46746.1 acylphosphatase [Anoxynatronum buryatiense]